MPDIASPAKDTVHKMDMDVTSTPTPSTEFPAKSASDLTVPKKPVPGSTLWYEIRKENHKKVERKRRETINQAMDDLGAVIPGNEKNKSRILGRAVEYIKALVEENHGLRKQAEQYWEANQQHQAEIASLKLQLKIQEQQLQGQPVSSTYQSSSSAENQQPEDQQTRQLPPLESLTQEHERNRQNGLSAQASSS